MRNIILILSDQHSGLATSMTNKAVKTPNLELMCKTGQFFENAYCNNPLCVPSRMSFLSGKSSFETGIFDNDTVLLSSEETLADKFNLKGYRTVLVGRMHFKGNDQKHGFQERYVGDITTQWWNQKRTDLGAFDGTMQMKGCLNEFGFGNSPVQDYDEAVFLKALDILEQTDKRPLFLVIGFYGPHFPYCVEEKYFNFYFQQDLALENFNRPCWDEYKSMQMNADLSTLQNIRSAYYGMIEKLDYRIGSIHKKIREKDQDAVVIYTSDHGDQIGKRKLFGKKTCYEDSVRIPLIIEDFRLKPKKHRHEVSLLNLHSSICRYGDIVCDMEDCLKNTKPIHLCSMLEIEGKKNLEQCVIWHRYKYIYLENEERLYDLSCDCFEENNIIENNLKMKLYLKQFILDTKQADENRKQRECELEILKQEYRRNPQEDWIRYKIKKAAIQKPERRFYGKV